MDQVLEKLVAACQDASEPEAVDEKEERIRVSSTVSTVASLYEWLRNSLEFKEEHLVRRAAIERILRRFAMLGVDTGFADGGKILRELIRAGYFPNDSLPESKGEVVSSVLARYALLLNEIGYEESRLRNFLLGLVSVEIEHLLAPREKLIEEAFVHFAYEKLRTRISWRGALRSPEHEAQLFIAAHRTILRSDVPTIEWTLFTSALPAWRTMRPEEAFMQLREISHLQRAIAAQLEHPAGKQYSRAIRRFVPAFTSLHDLIVTKIDAFPIFCTDRERFAEEVQNIARARTKTVHKRLSRMAVRATIYVFATKMLVAFAIELPVENALKVFRMTPFAVNLLFPPFLMYFAAKTAFVPGGKNIAKIVSDARAFVFGDESQPAIHEAKIRSYTTAPIRTAFFSFVTAAFFAGIIWYISLKLAEFGFTIVGILVFFFFLSVVSFFAWRIRQPVRDLTAIAPREDLVGTLVELLAFPFLLVGRWISEGFARVNISLVLLDFAIEAPLKLVLDFTDDWMRFLREKREEFLE